MQINKFENSILMTQFPNKSNKNIILQSASRLNEKEYKSELMWVFAFLIIMLNTSR
jgi:hypothetical protein